MATLQWCDSGSKQMKLRLDFFQHYCGIWVSIEFLLRFYKNRYGSGHSFKDFFKKEAKPYD